MNKITNLLISIGKVLAAASVEWKRGDDGRISRVSVFKIPFFDRQRREKRLRAKANRDKG